LKLLFFGIDNFSKNKSMLALFRSAAPISVDVASLILRIFLGVFMIYGHGWPKFMGYAERSANFFDPFGIGGPASMSLAIFAEIVCSLLVIAGLFTRAALIPLAVTMLVAAFGANWGEPFGKKELALMYLVSMAALFLLGSGRFSADAMLEKKGA